MRSPIERYSSRIARFSRPPLAQLDSPLDSCPDPGATRGVGREQIRLCAIATALLLLPMSQETLFAQQATPAEPGWSQNDPNQSPNNDPYNNPNNRQYAPDQSGDGQQPYEQQPDSAPGQAYPQQNYEPTPPQPLSALQLEQLVAPIALYADTLVAQVLAASTYPAQVVEADRWRQAQGYASPDQIAAGADAQTWDPSLKALTAFPQVLAEMDRNLQWTTALGNAYYNQPRDVLEAVQVMRQRAQAAGNLQNTPQEAVRYDQGNIELVPVNPQVVYVPAYNPWVVYGQPIAPYPGFSLLGVLGSFFGSSPIRIWVGDRDGGLQPRELGLVGLGPELAGPLHTLPSVELLFAQHHSGRLGFPARRTARIFGAGNKWAAAEPLRTVAGPFRPAWRWIQPGPGTWVRPPAGQICGEPAGRTLQPRFPVLRKWLRPAATGGLQPPPATRK